MAGYQQVAHHLRVVLLQHFADGEEIAQALGHLLAIDTHRTGVHPGVRVKLAGGRLALCDLVLVVRKHQVRAATMDVERLAQAAGGHHRTLDMPTGTPRAPRRIPARLARLGALPQYEVQRIFLGFVHFDTRTDLQVFDLATRQFAITDELADPVVDVPVARRIGEALVDECLDHRMHAGDMVGGARLDVRTQHVEAGLIFMHGRNHAFD